MDPSPGCQDSSMQEEEEGEAVEEANLTTESGTMTKNLQIHDASEPEQEEFHQLCQC